MGSGEVPRGEKMLYSGTDPESYTTEYTLVYEDNRNEEDAPPSGPTVGLGPALSQEPYRGTSLIRKRTPP